MGWFCNGGNGRWAVGRNGKQAMSIEQPYGNGASIREAERDIMSRPTEHNTTNLDLDRMNLMLDLLGHPEDTFRVIHVTGTNGKGSTARMAEAICRACGLRTGLYTSPHLELINERIAIDGQQLSDDDFVDAWHQVKDLIDIVDARMAERGRAPMSFFEVLTAMAIWKFADAPVDVAIVEVGMGGAWDATNVLNADAAVIGPIDMDHMQWLGDSVERIAGEKAGIIKPDCTVVVGPQPHEDDVMPVIEAVAERNRAKLVRDGREMEVLSRMPAVGGQVATLATPLGTYTEVPIAKFGEHQAHNALAALAAAEAVLPVAGALDGDVVEEALSSVRIPGRIEQVRTSPVIIVDGGHNVNAAESLREAVEENYHFEQLVGVVAMMEDKQVEEYLGVLEPVLSQVVVTENSWRERVMPADELEKIAVEVFGRDRVIKEEDLPDAIQTAVNLVDESDELGVGYGHGVLVCGSFVTAGDARSLLKEHVSPVMRKAMGIHQPVVEPDVSADDEDGMGDENLSMDEFDAALDNPLAFAKDLFAGDDGTDGEDEFDAFAENPGGDFGDEDEE